MLRRVSIALVLLLASAIGCEQSATLDVDSGSEVNVGQSIPAQPIMIAWGYLPGNAPTGANAQGVGGCSAVKQAGNNGTWLLTPTTVASFEVNDGSIMFMTGAGVPSDSNSGVVASIGPTGAGPVLFQVRHNDDGLPDNIQPMSFTVWQTPRQR